MVKAEHEEDSNFQNANFTIASIKKKQRQQNKSIITFNNNLEIILLNETVSQYSLFIGQSLIPAEITALLSESKKLEVYERALLLLSRRPHSCWQLKTKLGKKGFDEQDISWALEKLISSGYLDDRVFARAWLHSRINNHIEGKYLLLAGLIRTGVSREIAQAVLKEYSPEEEYSKIFTLLEKHGSYFEIGSQRLIKRLQARGFQLPLILKALREKKII
jgi:regulatory protein